MSGWDVRGRIHAQLAGRVITEALYKEAVLLLFLDNGRVIQVRFDEGFGPFLEDGLMIPHSYDGDRALWAHLVGRRIRHALTDGARLVLDVGNDETINISWEPHQGTPAFGGQDVCIPIGFAPLTFGI